MEPQQPSVDQNDDEAQRLWDEETAADDAAVSASGDATADGQDPESGDDADPAPAPAPADPEPKTEAPDPYAGLPEPVRNALAAIPQLEQRLRSAEGRVAAFQRQTAQAPAPAPAAETPKPTKLDALRDELPEVVAAIEEASARSIDPDSMREQLRAEVMSQVQEELLEERHPDWAQTVTGQDFQAWLQTQPADFQQTVRNATRASQMSRALDKFNEAKATVNKQRETQAARERRMAAAVTPQGTRRVPTKTLDDMTDDEYWDHISRDG